MGDILFALFPVNDQAWQVVLANPEYMRVIPGYGHSLSFSATQPSKIQGRLASFGKHSDNDICLPSHPYPREKYLGFHLFFYLARSGELVLRDLSPKRTLIAVENETPDNQNLYQLSGEPRQRVIPRGEDLQIGIVFGLQTEFRFLWNPTVAVSTDLVSQAQMLLPPGLTPTSQEIVPRDQDNRRYELRSSYAPSFQPKYPQKEIRTYFTSP